MNEQNRDLVQAYLVDSFNSHSQDKTFDTWLLDTLCKTQAERDLDLKAWAASTKVRVQSQIDSLEADKLARETSLLADMAKLTAV